MRISVSSITARSGDELSVCFELTEGDNSCKQSFVISLAAYTRLGIVKGECDRELYDAVERESTLNGAIKRGVYILSFGDCSAQMLISKLCAKGIDRNVAAAAVERICEEGLLDEDESAIREAERCVAKLWGEPRVRAKLAQRRYSREAVERAMYALEDRGVDYNALCKAYIDKKYSVLPTERAQMQKLVAAVCRQGYTSSQVKAACSALRAERRS